jgi:membrane-associated phospholipid phosphatase
MVNFLLAIIMTGIWFSAIYSSHHYIMDVLVGILCALTGIFLFNKVILKNRALREFVGKLVRITS